MRWLLMLVLFIQTSLVLAHARNNAFLDLVENSGELSGSLQLRLEDLPLIADVDSDHDQQLTWGEVKSAEVAIGAYITQHLRFSYRDSPCVLSLGQLQIQQVAGGSYLYVPLDPGCIIAGDGLRIDYSLLFAADAAHRGLASIQRRDASTVFVFAPQQQRLVISGPEQSRSALPLQFIEEGVWHIWSGYDHLLFLLALLIPLFVNRRPSMTDIPLTWQSAAVKVLKLVTAFTLAHSITLIAASIYQPAFKPALIETLIALSVLLAGINILMPMFDKGHWRVAFGFGLVHGLGFATALSGLDLPRDAFIECLLSFNLGVELGQLAILLPCIPLLLLCTRQLYFRTLVMPMLALMVVGISLWWAAERVVQI